MDMVARTLEVVEKMRSLLLDPHPGQFTWNEMLLRRKKELDELFEPEVKKDGQ